MYAYNRTNRRPKGLTTLYLNVNAGALELVRCPSRTHWSTMHNYHPEREQIRLENVLNALGNPLRLAVVHMLASGREFTCGSLLLGQSKSTMTRHWRVLREGGVIWQRPNGREQLVSLRRKDLDARFPGLMRSLLSSLSREASP